MSQEEMVSSFSDDPDSLENSLKIADLCQLELDSQDWHLPEYPVPLGRRHDEELRDLAFKGLAKRFQGFDSEAMQPYLDRLEHELESIRQSGFAAWFLFIADIVDLARQSNISLGPGRSFYPASLVSFCSSLASSSLGISEIDPLCHGLIFERFINVVRKNILPLFFIDVARSQRKKFIRLIAARYGKDRIGSISLTGCMEGKRLICDVGRVLNVSNEKISGILRVISKNQLMRWDLISQCEDNEQGQSIVERDAEIGQLLHVAKTLENLPVEVRSRAPEILITPGKLVDYCPVSKAGGMLSANIRSGYLSQMGLVSLSVYGLKDIDLIARISRNKGIDITSIPHDDEKTFRHITSGNTKGISELASPGMRKFLRQLRPSCLSDIAAALSLHRPPPIESGMAEQFIRMKHGIGSPTDFEVLMPDDLGETYGVIIYHEQIIEIAHRLAGYSYLRGEALRVVLVREKPELVEEERKMYLDCSQKNGIDQEFADEAFNAMVLSAPRAFTKSHVVALALLSYRVAWLKVHFPEEFKVGR